MSAIRDQEYAAVVERERPLIQATAYLLTGDPVRAERVVQMVFAELYGRLARVRHPRVEALRAVVNAARTPVHLPWESRKRVELIDGPTPRLPPSRLSPTLECSPMSKRVAIVLESYAELPSAQIAEVLQRPVGHVLSRAQHARAVLAAGNPERTSDEVLAQELRDAIPYDMRESHGSAD